jgi:hypothetical protein
MIDTRISDRGDVLELLDDLILIAGKCESDCPLDNDRSVDFTEGLQALKNWLIREVFK